MPTLCLVCHAPMILIRSKVVISSSSTVKNYDSYYCGKCVTTRLVSSKGLGKSHFLDLYRKETGTEQEVILDRVC